jgi:hypothetical protein
LIKTFCSRARQHLEAGRVDEAECCDGEPGGPPSTLEPVPTQSTASAGEGGDASRRAAARLTEVLRRRRAVASGGWRGLEGSGGRRRRVEARQAAAGIVAGG